MRDYGISFLYVTEGWGQINHYLDLIIFFDDLVQSLTVGFCVSTAEEVQVPEVENGNREDVKVKKPLVLPSIFPGAPNMDPNLKPSFYCVLIICS